MALLQSASDLARRLFAEFQQKAVPAARPVVQPHQNVGLVNRVVPQIKPLVQQALPAINTIGRNLGSQPLTPQVAGFKAPTLLQTAQTLTPLVGGKSNSPLSSFLSGQVQKIPSQIQANAREGYQTQLLSAKKNLTPVEQQKVNNYYTNLLPVGGIKTGRFTPEIESYLAGLSKAQKGALGKPTNIQRGKDFLSSLKSQIVDFTSPIEDAVNLAEKKGKFNIRPTSDVRLQIDRVLRSKSLASQFAQDNGLADVIKNAPDLNALDQYMIAKQGLRVSELGKKTGRNIELDKRLIQELGPQYEQFAQQVNQYSRKLLDYSVNSGLIDKSLAKQLVEKYPDYVPLNRIFSELEQNGFQGATKSIANLSRQTVVQKLKGSEREIQSPLESLLLKTQTAFEQGEKNIAARQLASYRDLPGFEGLIKPLRTAENVKQRINLYEQAADLKPIQTKLYTFIKTHNRQLRTLQSRIRELGILGQKELDKTKRLGESQINQLEKKGLEASLRKSAKDTPDQLRSKVNERTYIPGGKVTTDTGDTFFVKDPNKKATTKLTDIPAATKLRGAQSTRNFIESLITEPNVDIQAIKRQIAKNETRLEEKLKATGERVSGRIATKEGKLSPLLDEIQLLRDSLEGVKAQRGSLFDEARALKDAESRGKSIFSTLNGGIKEVYETTPEIASAAKNLDQQQMNILTKIIQSGTRTLQLGATALNPAFAITNLAKDQMTLFINSNKAARSSLLNPENFLRSFFSAVKHDKLYDEVIRNAGISTSFDVTRKEADLAIDKLRASKDISSKIAYTVKNPQELVRALENIIGRTEEISRIQSYRGTYQSLIKEGRTPQDARLLAAKAARNNTANFARGGSFGKVLNYAIPFFNAGIQGSRSFVNAAKGRPIETGAKFATVIGLPIAAATLWNTSDPKRKEVYDDLYEYEKQNNMIFIPDGVTKDSDGKYNVIKIPLPPGLSNLATIVRRTIEATQGADPIQAQEILSNLVAAGTGQSFNTGSLKEFGNSVASNYTPQIIKPIVESTTNTNLFTGLPIVPDSMKDLPPSEQYKDTTSATAKGVGKLTGQSPLLLENAVKTSLGGVGSQLLNYSDTGLAAAGVIPQDQIGGENPIQNLERRFTKAASGGQSSKEFDTIGKYQEGQAIDAQKRKQAITKVADILFDPNADKSQKVKLIQAISADKKLLGDVKDELRDRKLNVTAVDRAVRGLSLKQRASYIKDKLNPLSKEEKKRLVIQYIQKGILTKDVAKELKKQLSQ